MRDLKFRAWNVIEKTIEYPNIIDFRDNSIASYELIDGKQVFNNFVLMQYIGLQDKYVKEIYEDDILRVTDTKGSCLYGDGNIFLAKVVLRHSSGACLSKHCTKQIQQPSSKTLKDDWVYTGHYLIGNNFNLYDGFYEGYKYEVVGNIHENPELLK